MAPCGAWCARGLQRAVERGAAGALPRAIERVDLGVGTTGPIVVPVRAHESHPLGNDDAPTTGFGLVVATTAARQRERLAA